MCHTVPVTFGSATKRLMEKVSASITSFPEPVYAWSYPARPMHWFNWPIEFICRWICFSWCTHYWWRHRWSVEKERPPGSNKSHSSWKQVGLYCIPSIPVNMAPSKSRLHHASFVLLIPYRHYFRILPPDETIFLSLLALVARGSCLI